MCPCLWGLEEFRWHRWFQSNRKILLKFVLCRIKRELIRLQESSQNTFVKWQYEWNSQIQSHNVTAPKYELWTCDNCSGPVWSIMLHPLQMITVHYIQPHFWKMDWIASIKNLKWTGQQDLKVWNERDGKHYLKNYRQQLSKNNN